jgi:hypothetical protein
MFHTTNQSLSTVESLWNIFQVGIDSKGRDIERQGAPTSLPWLERLRPLCRLFGLNPDVIFEPERSEGATRQGLLALASSWTGEGTLARTSQSHTTAAPSPHLELE